MARDAGGRPVPRPRLHPGEATPRPQHNPWWMHPSPVLPPPPCRGCRYQLGPGQELFSFCLLGDLMVGGGQGDVHFWDRRTRQKLACWDDMHMDDVTQVGAAAAAGLPPAWQHGLDGTRHLLAGTTPPRTPPTCTPPLRRVWQAGTGADTAQGHSRPYRAHPAGGRVPRRRQAAHRIAGRVDSGAQHSGRPSRGRGL
jgi:hypothetical protein